GAKGPIPEGTTDAWVGATIMELAKPTSAHTAPVLVLIPSPGRLAAGRRAPGALVGLGKVSSLVG
ncbi:MAG: hypothetical protein ACLQVK_01085, partial [Acidimicrobiales bacterium]